MKPIIAHTELSFERYYRINIYMLLRRKVMWILLALAIALLVSTLFMKYDDYSIAFLGWFYLLLVLLMPVWVYFKSKSLYKKVSHMSEPKTYEFSEDGIKLSSETIKMETAWVNISKAVKRTDDYLLFSSNNRNFFNLPNQAFDPGEIGYFEELVKNKVSKRNF